MSPSAGHIVTLLALYFAALILAVQHVSDRYSPALVLPVLVRRALLPLVLLVALASVAAVLPVGGWAAGAMVVVAILASLGGSYHLWRGADDRERIGRLLRAVPVREREEAVREVLWNAAQRQNPRVAAVALRAFPAGTSERDRLLRWLSDQREVLAKEWLTREVVTVLLPADAANPPSEKGAQVLKALFVDALDREEYDRALSVLDAVMGALASADPWTQSHADLLHTFGFALWNVGEPGESVARRAGIPPRLDALRSLLHPRLRRLWKHLRELGDTGALERYANVLGRFAAETEDGFMLSRLYDVVEDGYRGWLWTEQALHQLASDLGFARRGCGSESGDPAFGAERIDSLAITGAAMLVETHGTKGLEHYLGNALLFKDSWRHVQEQEWLGPESYAAVQRALSRRQ